MGELCTDNRFELIEKYKAALIEATNIEMAPDEMAVIDDILFRFWQMGWLDKLDADVASVVRCRECKWWKTNYMWNGRECKVCVIEPYEPVRKPDDYCSRGERKDDADS